MDATAGITLAAGGEWLSETLDVFFGKRDVYPGAVVLPNRSAGDAFVWYSKLFIVSICHSGVRYNALAASAWQDGNEGRASLVGSTKGSAERESSASIHGLSD